MVATFVTADLHFGHGNIIKYCNRPFKNARAMDRALIRNWNDDVNPEDHVYVVGDFIYKSVHHWRYYTERLNGTKMFILGNHDNLAGASARSQMKIKFCRREFLLIHSPYDIPERYEGWVIHGHTHNNSTEMYPLISYEHKTINVSVELTNYRPVKLKTLLAIIRSGEKLGIGLARRGR